MRQETSFHRVRMSDVAQAADVSVMTVSRVMNGHSSVLDETRERVTRAIEDLGYRRNELARSLRNTRSRQVGILVPNLYDPFFALCAHAINQVSRLHGYSLSTATTDQDPSTEYDEASRMLQRSVDGLIVIPAGTEKVSRLLQPEFSNTPLVTIDRPASGAARKLDTIVVQNKQGAICGTEHLLSLGHKRIACIALPSSLYTLRMRIEGYQSAMDAAGLQAEVVHVAEDVEATLSALHSLLQRYRPTALFCANNVVTRQVLHALKAMGFEPPDPIALTGFDDFEFAALLGSGITVIRQPVETMARLAAETLFDRLAKPDREEQGKRIVLPVELIIRGSCGTQARRPSP